MAKRKTEFIHRFVVKLKPSFGGIVAGIALFCVSFTPSLLPRGYIAQGFASGLSFVTGYGIGVFLVHIYHQLPTNYQPVIRTRIKKYVLCALGLLVVVFVIAGANWQAQIRKLTDAESVSITYYIREVIIAASIATMLIWAARGARKLGKYFANKLNGHIPRTLAIYGGGFLAVIVLVFLVNGVLFRSVFGFIDYSFGLLNNGTPAGIHQPQDSIFSGSPQSYIDWNTLGEKGREFVASAPTTTAIDAYAGPGSGVQPSRLYVGLDSAPTLQDRVNLLIKELNRTKAGNRRAILIAIPTGSGGIDAKAVQSVEYLYGGNTTTIGIQYSYLPSWLSFVADQETARQTGKAVTEAVYDWWSNLDPTNRPKLLMYGESLGTLGIDGAFSGAADIHARMNGVLMVGPPNSNMLWSEMVTNRDAGSREVLPVYQNGEAVRFSDGADIFSEPKNAAWSATNRLAIVQNPSDPVVWASMSLFIHKPDWLREQRGRDVLPNMRWYPFVTGWQVALDLPFAFNATPGHGHRYGNILTQSWIAVLNEQLSAAKTKQLENIINEVKG